MTRRSGTAGLALPLRLAGAAVVALVAVAAPAGAQEATALPNYVSTPAGWKHVENDYLPGVTHSELGWFSTQRVECLKAQSIAARTFLLRWLNANGHGRTIPALGPTFQAYSSRPSSHTRGASLAVRGQVGTHQGRVVYANYVSGAWPVDANGRAFAPSRYGFPASYTWDYVRDQFLARQQGRISASTFSQRVTRYSSWAWTEVLATDNEGRRGADVRMTIHANRNERNRGGLGQYRAYWLDSERGYGYVDILRAFYGADLTVVGAAGGGAPSGGGGGGGGGGGSGAGGGPDLVVTAVRASPGGGSGAADLLAAGQALGLSATVRNQGAAFGSSRAVVVGFVVGGQQIGRGQRVLSLGAGEEAEIAIGQGGLAPGNPGEIAIEAVVDPDGLVAEASESNNRLRATRWVFAALEVTASALHVRTGPSSGNAVIDQVRAGQVYAARERRGDWYRIDLRGGTTGWCHGGYLRRVQGAAAVLIDTPALNVRAGPSANHQRIGGTTEGQVYIQIGAQAGWHRISWGGRDGWVSGSYVKAGRL